MPRPSNPDLTINWKISLPATLAGTVEHILWDPITNRPRYNARNILIHHLLERWLTEYNEGRGFDPTIKPEAGA